MKNCPKRYEKLKSKKIKIRLGLDFFLGMRKVFMQRTRAINRGPARRRTYHPRLIRYGKYTKSSNNGNRILGLATYEICVFSVD